MTNSSPSQHTIAGEMQHSLLTGMINTLERASKASANLWDAFSTAYDQQSICITCALAEVQSEIELFLDRYGDSSVDEGKLLKINVG
eukprot:12968128-Ditylum_brightwellii.AAC.1